MDSDSFEVTVAGHLRDKNGLREWHVTMTRQPNGRVTEASFPMVGGSDLHGAIADMLWAAIGGDLMAAEYGVAGETNDES